MNMMENSNMATTNEMNLPIIAVPSTAAMSSDYAMGSADATMTVGVPQSGMDCSRITVYANNIAPVSYVATDSMAMFDIVFSVGVNCEDDTSKTYQVVKRIAIDKCRIADDACSSMPVSVVESKSNEAALKEDAAATKKRFRRLAGLD